MQTVFEKLPSNTLRGRIAERIREAILDGSLPAGQRIVERRLAEQFGASLTAVREALIELESEGFIAKRPNSTTHVTQLSLGTRAKSWPCGAFSKRTRWRKPQESPHRNRSASWKRFTKRWSQPPSSRQESLRAAGLHVAPGTVADYR